MPALLAGACTIDLSDAQPDPSCDDGSRQGLDGVWQGAAAGHPLVLDLEEVCGPAGLLSDEVTWLAAGSWSWQDHAGVAGQCGDLLVLTDTMRDGITEWLCVENDVLFELPQRPLASDSMRGLLHGTWHFTSSDSIVFPADSVTFRLP